MFRRVDLRLPRTDHTHVTAADFDNDGFMDLYLTRFGAGGVRRPDVLLRNLGGGRFSSAPVRGDLPWRSYGERGDSGDSFDYDLLVRVGRPYDADRFPYIESDTLGAVVEIDLGDITLRRRVGSSGESHSQQYLDTVHFGLGARTVVYRITVTYPNGLSQVRRRRTPADRIVTFGGYSRPRVYRDGM
mmetsp:Transcript_10550/g.32281  ORF Transcript_10550/g.32281 Transcript_10550/m.32281 type:complete len:187 (-) Transcript_10550:2290-2850(-)